MKEQYDISKPLEKLFDQTENTIALLRRWQYHIFPNK